MEASDQGSSLLSLQEKERIVVLLQGRGVPKQCPMCKKSTWSIADGYFSTPIHRSVHSGVVLGGPTIPSIALVCTNCGFISCHAAGVLGLLAGSEGS